MHESLSHQDRPAYSIGEAAWYVRIAPATLSSWVTGREYPTARGVRHFHPLITLADPRRGLLSFNNLVEAHILRALRTKHGTPIKAIRAALDYAHTDLGIDRLLLSRELQTDAGEIFLDYYGALINLSRSGQLAMQDVVRVYLQRVEWDDTPRPLRLFPFVGVEPANVSRQIAIDPAVGFGRPIVFRRGISTQVIVDRIDAGETPMELAHDYGLEVSEVNEAIVYERAAA